MLVLIMSEDLSLKYLKTIKAKPLNTKKLFAIGLIGVTGVGKSTFAKKLSKKLDLYLASSDKIRRFLNDSGYPGVDPDQKLHYQISFKTLTHLLKNKISTVYDADLIKFTDNATKIVNSHGAEMFWVHLICPEPIILERLRARTTRVQKAMKSNNKSHEKTGHSVAGVEEYMNRRELHKNIALPKNIFLTINTSKEISPQILHLKKKLKDRGMI
jgi:predicted kinase